MVSIICYCNSTFCFTCHYKEFGVLGLTVAIVVIVMIISNNNKAFGFLYENFPLEHRCRGRSLELRLCERGSILQKEKRKNKQEMWLRSFPSSAPPPKKSPGSASVVGHDMCIMIYIYICI